MKITLLGTGTPHPSLKRACSGYMIEVGDDLIVMDHGPDAHCRLLESPRAPTEVTHVFISHLHYDHCLDYARLVLQRWDVGAGKIPDLKVYGLAPIARMNDLLFREDGVFGPDVTARTEHELSLDIYTLRGGVLPRARPAPAVTEVRVGDVVEGGDWRVTVGYASHVQPYLACLAFRLDGPGGSMCYSGDSGGECEEIIALAKGCVFDDDPQILKLVTLLLEQAGHEVVASSAADQATGIVVTQLPDVVITDRMMPGRDGLDVVRRLRRRKELTGLTIILMSVDSSDDARWRREAKAAGADDFIGKPFELETFAGKVEDIAQTRRGGGA